MRAIKDIYITAAHSGAGGAWPGGSGVYAAANLGAAPLMAVHSGANLNFDRLRHVAERAEVGEGNEALLAISIPERPGSYKQSIQTLGGRAITAFNYRYAIRSRHDPRGRGLRRGQQEKGELVASIRGPASPSWT